MGKNRKKKEKSSNAALKQSLVSDQSLDEIFDKYANDYDIDKVTAEVDKLQKQIDLQKYVYIKLHEKGLENTDLERLLDITIDECKEQYNIKQNIETKVGLLLALWGVVISVLITTNIPLNNIDIIVNSDINIGYRIATGIVLFGQVVLGVVSLGFSLKTLKVYGYRTVSLREKELNFKRAVDDKYIAIVQLLDSYTNRWIHNSEALKIKSKYYKRLIYTLALFVLFVIAGYICTYFGLGGELDGK